MTRSDFPRPLPKAISYASAVLSVAVAIVAAGLLTHFFRAEAIASLLLCAVIFVAWFGGFGPALLAIILGLFGFHYYLTTPNNPFVWKHELSAVVSGEIPRLVLFSVASLIVAFGISAQRKAAEQLRRSGEDLRAAMEDQKRIQAALLRSEMYLTAAQKLSGTGNFGWNVSSGELIWSDQTFRIFECDQATKPTAELIIQRTHPEDRTVVQTAIDRASRDGEDFEYAHRLLMPDGSVKYIHAVGRAQRNAQGSVEYVGAVTDVTATKQAQEKFDKAQEELARVTRIRTLGELTASIAHEVKQPIGATVTNAQAGLRFLNAAVVDTNELREILLDIVKDGIRANEVVNRMRDLTKNTPPRREKFEINEAIREVIAFIRSEAAKNAVSVGVELAKQLPFVWGDRVELQQVVLNLMMNGIEAMQLIEDRPRELVIRSVEDETRQVRVSVMDCGVGFSAENAEQLFSRFFTTKCNGLGMGLSICRSIIEAHNGRLWATANLPHGATFQFTLPVNADTAP